MAVRVVERPGERVEHMGAFVVGELPVLDAPQQLGEGEAVDVLHDEVGVAAGELKVVHGDDVGVRKPRGDARLVKCLGEGR